MHSLTRAEPDNRYLDTHHYANELAGLLEVKSMSAAMKVTVVGYGPTWALPV